MIETRLLARLLGLRLLRVEGTVLVSPGRLVSPTDGRRTMGPTARPVGARSGGDAVAPGEGLVEAERLLAESRGALRRTRS